MAQPTLSLREIDDPQLPAFRSLFDSAIPPAVATALQSVGSHVESARAIQITWSPGRQATVRYKVQVSDGLLRGERQVVATVGSIPEKALHVAGPDGTVGLWIVPNDPMLPGLASALHKPRVDDLLADVGIGRGTQSLKLRSYRPGRRAVVEAQTKSGTVFLKVVQKSEVERLHLSHRSLARDLPVPASFGYSTELGVVVLTALPGIDMRRALRDSSTPLPTPADLVALATSLPEPPSGSESRSPIERLSGVNRLLRKIVPDQSERLEELADAIGPELEGPSVAVHGDYHEAQVMTRDGKPVGLLDIDTYGLGRPGDDPATMLGHLALLARSSPAPDRVRRMALELNRIWDGIVDPVDLRMRVAATVLGLATGPFRVLRPDWRRRVRSRIDMAQEWLESAERIDERDLIMASDSPQTH